MAKRRFSSRASHRKPRGIWLEDLSWPQAERALTPKAVVVIPLGAAAKEHGHHLPLNTDWLQAAYFAKRIAATLDVVIAPTINYHYYPAFSQYPGSISIRSEIARGLVVGICTSLAAHGPRRFYVINTGISTLPPLRQAAEALARRQILLRFSDMREIESTVIRRIAAQRGGSHADEIETSKMLYIAPSRVQMAKAMDDFEPDHGSGALTRRKGGRGVYSPSGVWGFPTLATREKGRLLVEHAARSIIRAIRAMKREQRGDSITPASRRA